MIREGQRVVATGGFNSGLSGVTTCGCKSMNDKIQVRFDGSLFAVWVCAYLLAPEDQS